MREDVKLPLCQSFILLSQVGKISYSGEAGAAAEESFSTSTGKNFPPPDPIHPIHIVFHYQLYMILVSEEGHPGGRLSSDR